MSTFALPPVERRGVAADRTRDQYTLEVMRHPAGKPGHAYVAQSLVTFQANTTADLVELVTEYVKGLSA